MDASGKFQGKQNFSGKSASVTFFLFGDFYRCSKFLKETNKLIPTEIGYRHTYVRTSMNSYDLTCLGSKIKAQSMHSITKKPSFPNNILYSTKFSLPPILYRKLMCEFENSQVPLVVFVEYFPRNQFPDIYLAPWRRKINQILGSSNVVQSVQMRI